MKPMLAATLTTVAALRLPMLASPKLDGIRALVIDGVVYSRNMKPIPNQHVQKLFGWDRYNGLDGELIVGDPTSPACYRDTMSGCMSADGEPDVKLYVFDDWASEQPYALRLEEAGRMCGESVVALESCVVTDIKQVDFYEHYCLTAGYEGIMLRDPNGMYKHGRSTMREQGLVKVKRFDDAEATVIGWLERMHNGNELQRDELGRAKRTSHKANKSGRGDLGALLCRTPEGVMFQIGTGFTDAERAELWAERPSLINRTVKYKFFPTGSKEAPRFPVFLGFRIDGA